MIISIASKRVFFLWEIKKNWDSSADSKTVRRGVIMTQNTIDANTCSVKIIFLLKDTES